MAAIEPRERPILFSGPMVRALLAGTKTQTRRVVKPQPVSVGHQPLVSFNQGTPEFSFGPDDRDARGLRWWRCPHGVPGDRLWVREAYSGHYSWTGLPPREWISASPIWYWANGDPTEGDWTKPKPGMHMPRWASRITLEITDVRVERLNDISNEDAEAEGCPPCPHCNDVGWINSGADGGWQCDAPGCGDSYRDQYRRLWESINGTGSWEANPWVWAVSFVRKDAANAD